MPSPSNSPSFLSYGRIAGAQYAANGSLRSPCQCLATGALAPPAGLSAPDFAAQTFILSKPVCSTSWKVMAAVGQASAHAVETAVLRLRTALGDKKMVATVVKRGYRLPVDEAYAS